MLALGYAACAHRSTPPAVDLKPAADEELSRIAAAVTKALTAKGFPDGVHVLGVERRRDGVITINLSEDLLVETSDEKLTEAARAVLAAASGARTETSAQSNFVLLVNGALLESYLPSKTGV
jgi:sporulation and spore germination protein